MNQTEQDKADLKLFFARLSANIKQSEKFREQYNKEIAFDFNPLLHFGGMNENKVSKILAFFLDPSETHGQGKIFLDIFLRRFKLDGDKMVGKYEQVNVKTEAQTDAGRRIDITLCFDGQRFGVGIENKFYGLDQNDQLRDYCAHLNERHKGNYHLVYLSAFGENPETNSISEKQFEELKNSGKASVFNQWSDTIELIEEWRQCCNADTVRHFLKQFQQTIDYLLYGTTNMNNQTVIDFISEDTKNMQLAADVANNIQAAFPKLSKLLKADLEIVAKANGLQLSVFEMNLKDRECGFRFDGGIVKDLPFTIAFEWDGKWLSDGNWGFPDRNYKASAAVTARLVELFTRASQSDYWHYYAQWQVYKNFNYQTFADIKSGKFKDEVDKKLKIILEKLKGYHTTPPPLV